MKQIVEGFSATGPSKLAERITEKAEINNYKIISISAYCDGGKMYADRAIVIFEK